MIRQCAWCRRVKMKNDGWVPAVYIPLASHGICPDCVAENMMHFQARLSAESESVCPPGGVLSI